MLGEMLTLRAVSAIGTRIAANVLIDWWKKVAKEKTTIPPDDAEYTSPTPRPEDSIFALERVEQLTHCLQQLERNHHPFIRERFWGGLSYKEIAKKLEMSERDVKAGLWRAVRRLLKCMKLFESEKN